MIVIKRKYGNLTLKAAGERLGLVIDVKNLVYRITEGSLYSL
jgi:hypothetical protein